MTENAFFNFVQNPKLSGMTPALNWPTLTQPTSTRVFYGRRCRSLRTSKPGLNGGSRSLVRAVAQPYGALPGDVAVPQNWVWPESRMAGSPVGRQRLGNVLFTITSHKDRAAMWRNWPSNESPASHDHARGGAPRRNRRPTLSYSSGHPASQSRLVLRLPRGSDA